MPRSLSRSQRALSVASGLMLVLCLAVPTGWLAPATGVLAGVLHVPVQPLGDFALRLRNWIWAPDDPLAGESEKVRYLTEQLEMARQLAHRRQMRIESMEEQLRELQDARRFHHGSEVAFETLFARITGRPAEGGGGLLRLNAGARHGVTPGAVAVFRGGHLIGRVAAEVGRLSSWLVPLTDPATGLLEVVVVPAGGWEGALQGAPRMQLVPDGSGGLVGEADRELPIAPGDVVEVADPTWPVSAWGLKVGLVESLAPRDANPLLNSVRVVPKYPVHRVASVTLKIEPRAVAGTGSP